MKDLMESAFLREFLGGDDYQALQVVLARAFLSRHKGFDDWYARIAQIDEALFSPLSYDDGVLCARLVAGDFDREALLDALQSLMPWRKGRFDLAGVFVDSEWRSDWKFTRLKEAGCVFNNCSVLDVGTGNGYFLFRYLGEGARFALGLDPSWLYFAQFLLLQRFFKERRATLLPLTLNDFSFSGFDVVLSMGVLYHRRDPLAFLAQLRDCLKVGGELVIETLVVEGDENTVFMPKARYAGMRNVWFLPSVEALLKWLRRLNFEVVFAGAPVATTCEEQRQTPWMQSYSLAEFLAEEERLGDNRSCPMRAIVRARKL